MKLTGMDLYSSSGLEPLTLGFRSGVNGKPFQVMAIDGLDADNITARFEGTGGSGQKLHNMALQDRTLVLRLGLNPQFSENQTYSDLRDELYRIIGATSTGLVRLEFTNNHAPVCYISGMVTKLEAPVFSQDMEATLTIYCEDPRLLGTERVHADLSEADPENAMIYISDSTAENGFRMSVEFNSTINHFEIKDVLESWVFRVESNAPFEAGDVLHLSSERNDKYLYLESDGLTIHLADRVQPMGKWPSLFPRENFFVLSGGFEWKELTYVPHYWGV